MTTTGALLDDVAFTQLLLGAVSNANIVVRTHRRARGTCDTDPGLRDFTADLSVCLYIPELLDELPEWVLGSSYRDVPEEDMRATLARIHPLLERVAVAVTPEYEGLGVTLVSMAGSLLNAHHLQGSLHDALDSRSGELEAMYPAFTTKVWGDWSLKLDLGVNCVGSIVTLLTELTTGSDLAAVSDTLEASLVSQVLRDVSAGTDAVLTCVGDLEGTDPSMVKLRRFWRDLAFTKWRHGLWVADTATQAFADPADNL